MFIFIVCAFVFFFAGIFTMLSPAFDMLKYGLMIVAIIYGIKKISEIVAISRKKKETTEKELNYRKERISKAIDSVGIDTAFKCSSCGSVIPFNKDKTATFCPFCGSPIKNAEDFITQSLQHFENQQKREFELEKHRIELEKIQSQERNNEREFKSTLIIAIGLPVVIGILFILIPMLLMH